jgi:hypothetical protein
MKDEGIKGSQTRLLLSEFRVMYLVDICKEVIMTLTYHAKEVILTRLHSSLDSGSQLETNLCPINRTCLRL